MKVNTFWKRYISVLLLVIISSCSSLRKGEKDITAIKIEVGKIDDFIALEKKYGSTDITRDYLVKVSEGIYPYWNNHQFEIRKEYRRKLKDDIELEISYYYTKEGDVKLILYKWSYTSSKTDDLKFDSLVKRIENHISKKISPPSHKFIEGITEKEGETYRDEIKWENTETKAYLFRFGIKPNKFNEINLAVYKD